MLSDANTKCITLCSKTLWFRSDRTTTLYRTVYVLIQTIEDGNWVTPETEESSFVCTNALPARLL